jgi:hypothetical protein
VGIADGPNLDAFSRLRTSDPHAVFSSTAEYGRSSAFWQTVTSGSLSTTNHLNNKSAVELVCGTEADAYCFRQTYQFFHYAPGKSQLIPNTFTLGAAVANVVRRVGYYETENGIFLEQNGTTDVAFVRRSKATGSIVDTRVVQTTWNLDKLDGTSSTSNPSGILLDLSKAQILVIDLQWLGVGRVRMGFDIGGAIVYCHEFRNANSLTTVYMTTASLPIRYEIRNLALKGGTNTLEQICSTVMSEGGVQEESAYHFSANNGTTSISVTTRRAVLSIRPKATFGPSSRINRSTIDIHEMALLVGGKDVLWELVYNPTLTTGGGALTWTSAASESGVEYSVHGDANAGAFADGIVIESGYAGAGSGSNRQNFSSGLGSRFPLALDYAGANPIVVSIVITSTSTAATVYASAAWTELR